MQQNPHYLFLSLIWDFPPIIWLLMFQSFAWKNGRTLWDACQGSKLYAIYHNVGGYQYKSSLSRRDAVLINRLRIGHTRLTHSYLLSGDDQRVCSACQFPLTVKHFFVECVNLAAIRSRYFGASSMKDVFENVNAQSVIDFIIEMQFLSRIIILLFPFINISQTPLLLTLNVVKYFP